MADEQKEPEQAPDLMGYPSVEALVSAKRASDQEAMRMKERLDMLERAYVQQAQNAPHGNDPRQRMLDQGIPVDELDRYVDTKLQQRMEEAFRPITQTFQARGQVLARYPDYAKFEPEVSQFINTDPELAQTFGKMAQVDPAAALEYSYLKYGESRRKSAPQGDKRKVQSAAAEMQIPTQRSGDTRNSDTTGNDDVERARAHYEKTGDPRAYAKTRLRQVIPDTFFQQ